jgi:hypothetical protein
VSGALHHRLFGPVIAELHAATGGAVMLAAIALPFRFDFGQFAQALAITAAATLPYWLNSLDWARVAAERGLSRGPLVVSTIEVLGLAVVVVLGGIAYANTAACPRQG